MTSDICYGLALLDIEKILQKQRFSMWFQWFHNAFLKVGIWKRKAHWLKNVCKAEKQLRGNTETRKQKCFKSILNYNHWICDLKPAVNSVTECSFHENLSTVTCFWTWPNINYLKHNIPELFLATFTQVSHATSLESWFWTLACTLHLTCFYTTWYQWVLMNRSEHKQLDILDKQWGISLLVTANLSFHK